MNFLNNINWRNGQTIHPIERNLILLNHGRGLTNQQIAKDINRHPRTVERWLTKFHETDLMEKKKNPSRPRKTNFDDDVDIGLVAMENPRVTRQEIREELGLFNV